MNPIITTHHHDGSITEKIRSCHIHQYLGLPPSTNWMIAAHEMRKAGGWEGPRQIYFAGPPTSNRLAKGYIRTVKAATK